MSIEKDLSRIATSLEAIAFAMQDRGSATTAAAPEPAKPETVHSSMGPSAPPAPAAMPEPKADAAPAAPNPPPAQPAAPAAPAAAVVTHEDVDKAAVAKAEAMGDTTEIYNLMSEFGVEGLQQLPAEKLAEFKARLEAL